MIKKYFLSLYIFIILMLLCQHGVASSLTGPTGLITIPTAQVVGHGKGSAGMSFIDRRYLFIWGEDQYDGIVGFVTAGFLPFLELSICLKHAPDYPSPWQGLGDRVGNIRARIIKERNFVPSVLIGLQDPVGVKFSNSSYIVSSKSFHLPKSTEMDLHLGYGVNWIEAPHRHQFLGLFGGVSLHIGKTLELMLEHDSRGVNFGIAIEIFQRMQILIALLEPDVVSGGISTKFQL